VWQKLVKCNESLSKLIEYSPPTLRVKTIVVGDGGTGKTCLLIRATTGKFPEEYVPTVFDCYELPVCWRMIPMLIPLWDTGGGEDYERLRSLSYSYTIIFLICFAINNSCSLQNAKVKVQQIAC